jgi:hypothetical protein
MNQVGGMAAVSLYNGCLNRFSGGIVWALQLGVAAPHRAALSGDAPGRGHDGGKPLKRLPEPI